MSRAKISHHIEILVLVIFLITFLPVISSSQQASNSLKLLDAVKTTIARQPAVHIQEQEVEINKGILRQAESIFDPVIGAYISREDDNTPLKEVQRIQTGLEKSEQTVTSYQIGINKLLRSGITLNPNINMVRTDDLSFGARTANEASVNFTMIFPLLKGRGRETTEAELTAVMMGLEASELELRQTISQSVLNTCRAYWNYLAAAMSLDILREAEETAGRMIKDMEELVAVDERPASDLDQLYANLAVKRDDRIKSEQGLLEARHALGIAMGIALEETGSMPFPEVPFTQSKPDDISFTKKDEKALIELSGKNRSDLLALRKYEDRAKVLLRSAELNKKPQVDLSVNLGYMGLSEGESDRNYYDAFYHQTSGLNVYAKLSYQHPVGNNAAMAMIDQRRAACNQAFIQTTDMERKIGSDVVIAIKALSRSIEEMDEVEKSVSFYKKSVSNERLKLALGMSTIIDVLTVEDQLRNAMLREISAQNNYSMALINLRYATGTLIDVQENGYSITMEHLTSAPSVNPALNRLN